MDVDGPPLRVVALGDSSLTGPGLTHPDDVWLRVGSGLVGHDEPIELMSLAVGGSGWRTFRGGSKRPSPSSPIWSCSPSVRTMFSADTSPPVRTEVDRLIGRLLAGVPIVAVANVGDLGNIARVPRPLDALFRARALLVCSIIEEVVASRDRAVLIDVTAADHVFRDRSVSTPDLFHPGPVGHAAWADAWLPGLRRAVDLALSLRTDSVLTSAP